MGVNADLGVGVENVPVGTNPLSHVRHQQSPARVGHVDAVCAVGLHELGLPGQLFGRSHVAHHQEAGHVHAQFACGRDVLSRDVGLGAMGSHANGADSKTRRAFQGLDGADARQKQRRQPGSFELWRCGFDPLPVGVRAGSIGQRAACESVAMGNFDGVDAGLVERGGDAGDL